jgi:hypothetical protein
MLLRKNFGRHVTMRAAQAADRDVGELELLRRDVREPIVAHDRAPAPEEDVAWLEVAMDDVPPVKLFDPEQLDVSASAIDRVSGREELTTCAAMMTISTRCSGGPSIIRLRRLWSNNG